MLCNTSCQFFVMCFVGCQYISRYCVSGSLLPLTASAALVQPTSKMSVCWSMMSLVWHISIQLNVMRYRLLGPKFFGQQRFHVVATVVWKDVYAEPPLAVDISDLHVIRSVSYTHLTLPTIYSV